MRGNATNDEITFETISMGETQLLDPEPEPWWTKLWIWIVMVVALFVCVFAVGCGIAQYKLHKMRKEMY